MVRYTIKAEDGWIKRVDVAADNLRYMREQIDPANGGIGLDGWPRWSAGRTVSPDWTPHTSKSMDTFLARIGWER